MTDSHVAEGATRSTAIYALFHHSKAFVFPWILVDCRGCSSSVVGNRDALVKGLALR